MEIGELSVSAEAKGGEMSLKTDKEHHEECYALETDDVKDCTCKEIAQAECDAYYEQQSQESYYESKYGIGA